MKKEPCPHCLRRKNICEQQRSKYEWYYRCTNCGLSGPIEVTKEDAIAAWNALPRRLRWTKERPTESGEYKFRNKKDGECFVDVNIEEGTVLLYGLEVIADFDELVGEWAGPLLSG